MDHPRSRGVYTVLIDSAPNMPGSSPLARGLRPESRCPHLGPGIIPARAGFTDWNYVKPTPSQDHPRSRGVYGVSDSIEYIGKGSSPLARGLHRWEGFNVPAYGIIPARAGFTGSASSPNMSTADHPRSRGVYRSMHFNLSGKPGSSPLARGLQVTVVNLLRQVRIIPARAGFTCRPP